MRTFISKLSALAIVALLAGCTGSNGTAVPATGGINSPTQTGVILGGTTTTTGTTGLGTPPANTITPVSIDNGPLAVAGDARTGGKIAGFFGATTFVADAAGPESLPATDAGTPARPTNTAGSGSHTLAFTGPTANTVIFKDTVAGTTPALFYNYGASVGIQNFITYSALAVHAALATAAGAAAPAGTTISVEISGGTGAALYDIRTPCTGTIPTTITAASSILSCPLPGYGQVQTTTAGGFVSPGAANVQIPTTVPFANPVASASAIGQFVPNAGYSLYFVVTFPSTQAASASYVLSVDNVYAIQ
jgi:hypothetical protein